MNLEERKALFEKVDVYPVTCERLSAGRSNLEVLDAVIRGGAKIIQLREKELSTRELYRQALVFRGKTAAAGVLLIIDDRLDIALAVNADGVHLGLEDLPRRGGQAGWLRNYSSGLRPIPSRRPWRPKERGRITSTSVPSSPPEPRKGSRSFLVPGPSRKSAQGSGYRLRSWEGSTNPTSTRYWRRVPVGWPWSRHHPGPGHRRKSAIPEAQDPRPLFRTRSRWIGLS